jgi:hypothetical protein
LPAASKAERKEAGEQELIVQFETFRLIPFPPFLHFFVSGD